HVSLKAEIVGELGDNIMLHPEYINEDFMQEVEELIEAELKINLRTTLDKLQDIEADITNIGKETYRKYPNEWREIKEIYHEEVFPDATIDIHVIADIFHQGLINKSVNEPRKKPENNPFPFLD